MTKQDLIDKINELRDKLNALENAMTDIEYNTRQCVKILDSLPSEVDEIDEVEGDLPGK